jgi:glycosyltransferase involved in cell wall biosynthesis
VLTSRRGVRWACEDPGPVFRWLHSEIDYESGRIPFQFLRGQDQRLRENILALNEALTRLQPDVVVAWGMWNLSRELLSEIETRAGTPIVYYLADYWPVLPDAFTLHWQEPARRLIMRWPKRLTGAALQRLGGRQHEFTNPSFDHVLCVSAATRDHLQQNGVRFGDVRVIYNGIRSSSGRAAASTECRPGTSELRIVYAGRLSPEKGLGTALSAMALLRKTGRQVSLTIAGSGPPWYERELLAQAQTLALGTSVSLIGRVERSQLPSLLGSSDVMVVPSVWADPLPRIIQEGMDAGLVVVASEVGGIPEIVEHNVNGLLFPPGDGPALARLIEGVQDDPELRSRLAAAATVTVRARFGIDRTIQEIEDYLCSLVARSEFEVESRVTPFRTRA